MTAHSRFRTLVAVAAGALIASTAMAAATVAPADAGVPRHKHDLSIYKTEKYVKLQDADLTPVTVSCAPGDYALDGMWELRAIDKAPNGGDPDDDPTLPGGPTGTYNDLRDVYVNASYPNADNQSWNFEFQNNGYGDAQLSAYVVCIDGTTQATNGHSHNIGVRWLFYNDQHATSDQGWAGRVTWDSSGAACSSDEYFVAPGFNLTGTTVSHRLVASYATNNGKSWVWEFGASAKESPFFYGKCINRRVLAAAGHRHTLAMSHQPSLNIPSNGHYQAVTPGNDWRDVTYACDQDVPAYHGYKAAVGMFYLGFNWEHTWFYGMEPRPKIRSFRFFNDSGSNADVRYGALCINTRTSNPYS